MSSTANPTADRIDPTTTNCVAGESWCPGPDADRLPCYDCHVKATCPNGNCSCDAGDANHEQGTVCFLCAADGGLTDASAL